MEEKAFDPIARAADKQRSRDEDEVALRRADKTREQLESMLRSLGATDRLHSRPSVESSLPLKH